MCGVIHDNFGHCVGCRCFDITWNTTTTSPIFTTPTYVPKHRKPGPAQ